MRHAVRRDFRLLWFGETVSKLGTSVTTVALPLVAVLTLHANTFIVAALTAAEWIPWLLIGLPAGAWVDRMARRPVMLACDIASAALFVSVPIAAWLGVLTIGQLMAVALLTGVASAFFTIAYQAYLPALVPADDLAEGNAKLIGADSAAQLGGRGFGGLFAQWFGAVLGLFADAVSFLVSMVCLLAIRAREPAGVVDSAAVDSAGAAARPGLRREIAAGLRLVSRDPYLRAVTADAAVGNLALMGYQSIQVVFLVRVLDVPTSLVGWIVAGSSVGGIAGAMLARRVTRRFGSARGLLLCLIGTSPVVLLVPLAGRGFGVLLVVFASLVSGAGVVAGNVIIAGFRQSYCPPAMLGRVVATGRMASYGAIPLGAVLAGGLGALVGVRPTVWIMLGIYLAGGLILWFSPIRGRRDLPTLAVMSAGAWERGVGERP
ncbi:MAG TPA: MFS transporter [Pseudonocardiaceae bacterium]|nr:MFS transporter [Pseudonocardiaceae bacterium]